MAGISGFFAVLLFCTSLSFSTHVREAGSTDEASWKENALISLKTFRDVSLRSGEVSEFNKPYDDGDSSVLEESDDNITRNPMESSDNNSGVVYERSSPKALVDLELRNEEVEFIVEDQSNESNAETLKVSKSSGAVSFIDDYERKPFLADDMVDVVTTSSDTSTDLNVDTLQTNTITSITEVLVKSTSKAKPLEKETYLTDELPTEYTDDVVSSSQEESETETKLARFSAPEFPKKDSNHLTHIEKLTTEETFKSVFQITNTDEADKPETKFLGDNTTLPSATTTQLYRITELPVLDKSAQQDIEDIYKYSTSLESTSESEENALIMVSEEFETATTHTTTSTVWGPQQTISEGVKPNNNDTFAKHETQLSKTSFNPNSRTTVQDILVLHSNDFAQQTTNIFNESLVSVLKNDSNVDIPPIAEKLYYFQTENDDSESNFNNNSSDFQPLRDYVDKSEEDKTAIKSLLNDHPSFMKEKIEPGVLFEECPDCDLRILPIRPSEQRSTSEFDTEYPPSFKIRFADLPEGEELQINKLGLSDGIFLFSYLSQFLSWIQPNEFPVDLLREALRNQITWMSLIAQSLQVEAGFVACLVAGVLLALAVPIVVLSHACYRMGGRPEDSEDSQGWAGNCRRRTLIFILQLLLILLLGGMVAMFVTNEQLSSAVVQSSDVLQTSLSDVSSFVHNSHLQLHFLVTQSLDQALQAIYADLDNVDSLLGLPIQKELVRDTGLDVALESLSDLTRETKSIIQQVERFIDEVREVQEMLVSSREKLQDLRQQVELFRRACGLRDRVLCDTIDASGLEITLRLDKIKSDERLNRMRRMGGVGLELAMVEAKEHYVSVPSRVAADTRDSREAVRRLLIRKRSEVEDKSEALEQFARGVTTKVNEAKYQAGFWMRDVDQYEYWRWIICLGGAAAVLMIFMLLLFSMCCGCCGSERAAGPTILVTIVLVCLFSTVLWTVTLVGLLLGGHGEVFMCRPLYDEPQFPVITNLVDQPGVFYTEQRGGGFIANVIYGNDTLDVPIKQILQECQHDRPIYTTMGLQRVFDVDQAVDQHRWSGVSTQLRAVRANLSSLEVLSPALQQQLTDLLSSLSVNFTEHRIQISKPLTGKDLDSFAKQLDNIGNQLRDLATASRMETLSTRTRRLIDSHIRPLEGRKDALVYQLTALEVQTGPLQRQVNQSLSHLKTIQFFINSQGETIAQTKSREYVERLLGYLQQLREHVTEKAKNAVAPCRPLWDIFNNSRLFLCRHTMDPLNGYWFATMWCLLVLLVATPVCLKLVDYYRAQGTGTSGSPESLITAQTGSWSSPGYDAKIHNGHVK